MSAKPPRPDAAAQILRAALAKTKCPRLRAWLEKLLAAK